MLRLSRILAVVAVLWAAPWSLASAADAVALPTHILGKSDAPIVVEEYASLTCPHCADFYDKILPELQAKYIDSGKVRLVFHPFVRDGLDLKASALAYCMPTEQFYPFLSTLFKSQAQWSLGANPDNILVQYAKLGGLDGAKAAACLNDKPMQDALIAVRTQATDKLKIEATPTFIINNGAERMDGARSAAEFSALFDRLLAAKVAK